MDPNAIAPEAPVAAPIAPAQEPGAQVVTPAPVEPPANWYDSDVYKEYVPGNEGHFQKYKTESAFVKAGIEAMKGRSSEAIPKTDDPKYAEKMTSLYDAMGRPNKAEDYDIKMVEVPAELKDKISFSDDYMTAAKDIAAKHRMSKELLNDLAELQQTMVIESESAMIKARLETAEKVEAELSKDGNYATDKELVKRLLSDAAYDGLWQELETTGLGNSPQMFKLMSAFAKETLGEGSIDPASPGSAPSAAQPNSEAATKRAEYEADKAKWPHSSPSTWRHSAEFHHEQK